MGTPPSSNTVVELDFGTLTRLSDHVVMIRGHDGIEMDADKTRRGHEAMGQMMPGDYGLLVDRHPNYSLDPIAVFEVLNQLPRLKAIAIVVQSRTSAAVTSIDKRLSKRPLAVFDDMAQAHNWLHQQLGQF